MVYSKFKLTSCQRMKPLVTNRRVLTWLCVHPADETTSKFEKISYFIFSLIVFSGILSSLIASIAFFYKYVKVDLEVALYAVSQIAAASSVLYAIIMTLFSRPGITDVFKRLTIIYNESKSKNYLRFLLGFLKSLIEKPSIINSTEIELHF